MGRYILLACLLLILALTVGVATLAWNAGDGVEISGHGYAAMTLGIIFSLLVGVGLMSLVFYSSRKGYDRSAERERRD